VSYEIVFRDAARKSFERLDKPVRQQIGRVIDRLHKTPARHKPHSL
jgi:mRNA-degrading endonuclease RelE of RelBE toxin-antitoxin system